MQRLYEARDSLEARMLIDHLAAWHIRAAVLGEYLSGAAGELTALNFPWVWVMEDGDLPRARQLLDDFLRRADLGPAAGAWVCLACRAEVDEGFELCWQCGARRLE